MSRALYMAAGEEFRSAKMGNAVVAVACEAPGDGNWWCMAHDVGFRNNMERNHHLANRPAAATACTLAWFCVEHGIEEA